MSQGQGIVFTAFNNEEIDYWHMASTSALMAKKNLKKPVTLITSSGVNKWAINQYGNDYATQCFDHIIELPPSDLQTPFNNKKIYHDGRFTEKKLSYYNMFQTLAYQYTPYDETLAIDVDYLIMSDILNQCWNSDQSFMATHYYKNINDMKIKYNHIKYGIDQLWTTVIYFRKSEYTQLLYDLVSFIQERWSYYRKLYMIDEPLYRNDYAFAIANHILNGFTDYKDQVQLPQNYLLMSWGNDDIYSMPECDKLIMFSEIPQEPGNYLLSKIEYTDIHVMNKWAVQRISESIKEHYL